MNATVRTSLVKTQFNAALKEVGATRVAEQREQTTAAQATGEPNLSKSVSNDPNVLVSKFFDCGGGGQVELPPPGRLLLLERQRRHRGRPVQQVGRQRQAGRPVNGPTTARVCFCENSRAANAFTSWRVTAATRPSTSSMLGSSS